MVCLTRFVGERGPGAGQPPEERASTQAGPLPESLLAELAASVAAGEPSPGLAAALLEAGPLLDSLATPPAPGTPYSRQQLHATEGLEVMLATWEPGLRCAPHDHGGSHGCVSVVHGTFHEQRYGWVGPQLCRIGEAHRTAGQVMNFGPEVIHDMVAPDGGLTLHAYAPAPTRMSVFDLAHEQVLDMVGDFGAWLHEGDHPATPFARAADAARAAEA